MAPSPRWLMMTQSGQVATVTDLSPLRQVVEVAAVFGVASVVAHTVFDLSWPWAMAAGIAPIVILGVIAFALSGVAGSGTGGSV